MPLAVQAIAVSHPLPVLDQHEHLTVIATSIDAHNARLRVCQKACERYASRMVDQRRLLPYEIVQQHTVPTVSIDSLPGMKPRQIGDGLWAWALDMHTQQAHLLPAAHAFAAPDEQNSTSAHEQGIASGWSWEEAVSHALLDWCNYFTIEQIMQAHYPYRQVDLARTLTTSVGRHLYHLLTTAGYRVTAYDITGALHVPTFAICSGEQVMAYSTHCDVEEALKSGLEQALQCYQAEQFQQPEYTTDPVPDLLANLRGEQLYVPCYTPLPNTWSARMEWLLQQFQANGWRVFALPLDHDPALAQVLPYIVRLLLTLDQDNNTKRITLS
jgi:hypothetical protein